MGLPDSELSINSRLIRLLFVLLLSLVLPALILVGALYLAFSGWPPGLVMPEQHQMNDGFIKDGELWYPVTKYLRSTYSPPRESRIVRLDLKTGERRETGLKLPADRGSYRVWEQFDLLWTGDHLYAVDRFATIPTVWRSNESKFERFSVLPPMDPKWDFFHAPFIWNGHLAVVLQSYDGEFRLARFINGDWEKGRRIRLPKTNSRWIDGSEGPRIGTDEELLRKGIRCYLTVVSDGTDLHVRFVTLNYQNFPLFAAYRKGFEVIDGDSALSDSLPENIDVDCLGWEQIDSSATSAGWWGPIIPERDGVLFGIHDNHRNHQFVRRIAEVQWKVLSGLEPSTEERVYDNLITGASGTAYVCRGSTEWWGRFTFYPIHGDTIGPAELTLPGDEQRYVNRWGRFASGIFLAWVTHIVVLMCGQRLCHSATSEYQLTIHTVVLASLRLRSLAFLIDAMIMLLVVAISFSLHWNFLEIKWDRDANQKISRLLSNAEMNFDSYLNFRSYYVAADILLDPSEFLGRARDADDILRVILVVFVDTFVPLWLYRTYREGRSGMTLGKQLTGIRAVRLTERQCGFARAVVRSVLYLVDFAMFISPLPATIIMMLSPCRQRLGDRLADTVVIESK